MVKRIWQTGKSKDRMMIELYEPGAKPDDLSKEVASKEDIDKIPTYELAPLIHAQWIVDRDYGNCKCSVCETVYEDNGETISDYWNYCPHCGAKMDEQKWMNIYPKTGN